MAINRRIVFDDAEISSPEPNSLPEYYTRGDEPAEARSSLTRELLQSQAVITALNAALITIINEARSQFGMKPLPDELITPRPTKPRDALEDPRFNAQFAKLEDLRDGLNPFEDD